jgi:tripartite-type tricarboxylate transporter receptor subunit TctC
MKLPRRQFLHLAAGAAALPAIPSIAHAQAYPARPVRLIVPFAPGGTTDIVARLMGQRLSDRLRQPFVIENRPGANGNIATEMVVRSAGDGYALVMINVGIAINQSLYDNLTFSLVRDIAPVASIYRVPLAMTLNPSVPARTVPEFIAYAKANPGKIDMASGGTGSPAHVSGELFKMLTGVNIVHVPYRGDGPAITDLLAGQVQVMFAPVPASIAHIQAGKLRALGVSSERRIDVLPDVPTISDFVPGYEATTWQGLGAPKNLPAEIVDTLNKEINTALADPAIAARLTKLGGVPAPLTPAEFGTLIAAEIEKWARVVKFSGAKPD